MSRNDNDAEDGLPLPPGLGGATERHLRHYSIEIFDFSQAWLPLPYPTRKVSDIDGTWLYDPATFNVFGENSSTRQISYKVTALDVTYDPESLRTAGPAPVVAAQVPAGAARHRPPGAGPGPRGDHRSADRVRPGAGAADLAARPERVHLQPDRRRVGRRRQRLAGDPRLPADAAGLLRALRLDDGRDGAPARDPGAGRGRLRPRSHRAGQAGRRPARAARVAGAVLPGLGLGAVRAHPRRAGVAAAELGPGGARWRPAHRPADRGADVAADHDRRAARRHEP